MKLLVTVLVAGATPIAWSTPLSAEDTRVVRVATKPCKFEDSPGPCFWDAGRRGNHRGYSFWVDRRNRIHYLDPRKGTAR